MAATLAAGSAIQFHRSLVRAAERTVYFPCTIGAPLRFSWISQFLTTYFTKTV